MLRQTDHESQTPPAGWRQVILQGGPHNRVRINLHEREDHIVLSDGPRQFTYYRSPNGKPEFIHEAMLGGGK
ncbi:MAG: hypothetical protein WD534_11490 [Phycisphaeraceae bacterium]